MPTLFILFGYRFFFWSNDHEPVHVHVNKGDCDARFSVDPVEITENYGFKSSELKMIESLIEENKEIIIERWNDFFKTKR